MGILRSGLFLLLTIIAFDAMAGTLVANAQTLDATYTPGKTMWAAKRANVRSGPSTSHPKIGLLEVGAEVRVAAKTGRWFKLEAGATEQARFVYAPLLTDSRLIDKTITYNDGVLYRGQTKNGKPHGRGVVTKPDGTRYAGEFVGGRPHGRGIVRWSNGSRYDGDFVKGRRTGWGVISWTGGDRYEGGFANGHLHGQGTYFYSNGDYYQGRFEVDEPDEYARNVRTARSCVTDRGIAFTNICDDPVAFQYCFTETDGRLATCGRPSVKELIGEPEHYYTHLTYLQPNETFRVPFGNQYGFRWVVCPYRGNGIFYHAVASRFGDGSYRCKILWRSVSNKNSVEHGESVRRARAVANQRELERRRQQARWKREERDLERARRSSRTWRSLLGTLDAINRGLKASETGSECSDVGGRTCGSAPMVRPRQSPGFCMDLNGRPIPGGCR